MAERQIVRAVLAAVFLASLAGCANSTPAAQTAATPSAPSAAASPSPSTPDRVFSGDLVGEPGASYFAALVGEPATSAEGLTYPDPRAGNGYPDPAACEFDPDRDALVPVLLEAQSYAAGQPVVYAVQVSGPSPLTLAAAFGSETKCYPGSPDSPAQLEVYFDKELTPPGILHVADVAVIVHGTGHKAAAMNSVLKRTVLTPFPVSLPNVPPFAVTNCKPGPCDDGIALAP